MKHVIDAAHGGQKAARFPDVTEKELQPLVAQDVSHVILFLLVTAEDADFGYVGLQVAPHHGVAKGASPTGD